MRSLGIGLAKFGNGLLTAGSFCAIVLGILSLAVACTINVNRELFSVSSPVDFPVRLAWAIVSIVVIVVGIVLFRLTFSISGALVTAENSRR